MSRAIVGLAILVLVAPLAHANAPPVAHPTASTLEAVLGEPVTFTDASVDPDGWIAESRWTDVNGRSHVGPSFTYAFEFAGHHSIGLRTTDNDGASVLSEIRVLVRAPLMHGRATALAAGDARAADTGAIAQEGESKTGASVGEAKNGQLRAAALDAEVWTLGAPTQPRTISRADVGFVHVPLPVGFIRATGVESEVIARCSGTQTAARFTQLRFNDAPLVPPGEVAPNTRVALPGGVEVVLNAQETTPSGALAMTALRVVSPDGAVAEVARAQAGVSWCPYAT